MTTYCKQYILTDQHRALLRDVLIYTIAEYDSLIKSGHCAPYLARRSSALTLLHDLCKDPLYGDDSIMIMLEDVIKLCNPVSTSERADFKRTFLRLDGNDGLIGILCLYSNETINELKTILSSYEDVLMTSTSSFCM